MKAPCEAKMMAAMIKKIAAAHQMKKWGPEEDVMGGEVMKKSSAPTPEEDVINRYKNLVISLLGAKMYEESKHLDIKNKKL